MDGKDRVEVARNIKKVEPNQLPIRHVVSEGSVVVLDACDLIGDTDTSSIKNYSWKQRISIGILQSLIMTNNYQKLIVISSCIPIPIPH
jgi:hypothetical protein